MTCTQEYCACPECMERHLVSRSKRTPHDNIVANGASTFSAMNGPGSVFLASAPRDRTAALPGYESLAAVLDAALDDAQQGKGLARHASRGEAFAEQQIVQFGEWLGNTGFQIGQACKKAIESERLPYPAARAELLGAINYLAAAVIVLDRRNGGAR